MRSIEHGPFCTVSVESDMPTTVRIHLMPGTMLDCIILLAGYYDQGYLAWQSSKSNNIVNIVQTANAIT